MKIAAAGSTRMDEMKATWKETRMWLAMTQPSWSEEHGDMVARRTISLDLFLSPAVYRVRRVAAIQQPFANRPPHAPPAAEKTPAA